MLNQTRISCCWWGPLHWSSPSLHPFCVRQSIAIREQPAARSAGGPPKKRRCARNCGKTRSPPSGWYSNVYGRSRRAAHAHHIFCCLGVISRLFRFRGFVVASTTTTVLWPSDRRQHYRPTTRIASVRYFRSFPVRNRRRPSRFFVLHARTHNVTQRQYTTVRKTVAPENVTLGHQLYHTVWCSVNEKPLK